MSHVLAVAAEIVGAVALIATGIGAAAGAGIIAASGITAAAATVASIATLATIAIAAAAFLIPKPNQVQPMAWRADPQAGIPYGMGRCYIAGNIIYRSAWGSNNVNQTLITVLSGAGPHQSIDQLYVDGVACSISGVTVNIPANGTMFASYQLGHTPEASQLGSLGPPGLTTQSKLSGYAATSVTCKYDTKGNNPMTSIPQVGWVGKWAKVYDPRKDTTYTGGSGAHRSGDEMTWEWSENPYLHALTWLIGRRQNGKMMLGVGAPIAGILVDQFVEGANVADANGWTMAGVVYSTDDKWNVLKLILQAGGGEPLRLGAQIGCLVYTPKVSLATISVGDVVGDATVQATQSRRDRINAVVPRYMVEQGVTTYQSTSNTTTYAYNLQTATSWGIQPASPVIVPEYVAFDGKVRQKEIEFSLVTQLNQAVQLARYAIENAREFGPITLPLKLRWMGYKPGDVVTANLPELGLNGQDILLLNRALSPQNGTVTMTARSETAAKHAFALGQTGTAPSTPSVSGKPLLPIPGPAAWAATGGVVTAANGTTQPVINLVGAVDAEAVDSVVIEYRTSTGSLDTTAGWTTATSLPAPTHQFALTGLRDNGYYDVAISYRCGSATGDRLILGPVSCGVTNVPWLGVVGVGRPQDDATRNVPRGEWNAITLYGQGDIVTYLGSSYLAGESVPAGTYPTNAVYWDLLAAQGATGGAGAPGADGPIGVTGPPGAPGVDGVNPSLTTLTATSAQAHYNASGTYQGGDILFSAVTQNSGTAAIVWRLRDVNGSTAFQGSTSDFVAILGGGSSSPDANSVVMSAAAVAAQMTARGGTTGSFSVGAVAYGFANFADIPIQRVVDGAVGIPGAPGANGQPAYVHVAYADSADGSVNFVSGLANPGRAFIGIYTDVNAGGSSDYHAYYWSRLTGQDGVNGATGTPGPVGANGAQTYVHFAYADAADGSVNFAVGAPGTRKYIGVYSDYTSASSNSNSAYSWSLIKGADGLAGAPGATGSTGSTGGPGAPGANGADAYTVDLSVVAMTIAATYTGSPHSGELPRNSALRVLHGTTDVTASASIALSPSSGITASVSGTSVSVTAVATPGYVDVTPTYAGITLATKRIAIAMLLDNAPPSSITGTSQGLNQPVSSTTYDGSGASPSFVLQTSTDGKINVTGGGIYRASVPSGGSSRVTVAGKMQYRVVGTSSWTDAGSETVGEEADYFAGDGPSPGAIAVSQSITGLTASTNYEFRFNGRIYSQVNSASTVVGGTQTAAQA